MYEPNILKVIRDHIVLSELWLYDNEIIHTRGGIIAPQVPSLRGTRGAIIPPQVWIISLSYNQSSDNSIIFLFKISI